jgi:hypothetical protein
MKMYVKLALHLCLLITGFSCRSQGIILYSPEQCNSCNVGLCQAVLELTPHFLMVTRTEFLQAVSGQARIHSSCFPAKEYICANDSLFDFVMKHTGVSKAAVLVVMEPKTGAVLIKKPLLSYAEGDSATLLKIVRELKVQSPTIDSYLPGVNGHLSQEKIFTTQAKDLLYDTLCILPASANGEDLYYFIQHEGKMALLNPVLGLVYTKSSNSKALKEYSTTSDTTFISQFITHHFLTSDGALAVRQWYKSRNMALPKIDQISYYKNDTFLASASATLPVIVNGVLTQSMIPKRIYFLTSFRSHSSVLFVNELITIDSSYFHPTIFAVDGNLYAYCTPKSISAPILYDVSLRESTFVLETPHNCFTTKEYGTRNQTKMEDFILTGTGAMATSCSNQIHDFANNLSLRIPYPNGRLADLQRIGELMWAKADLAKYDVVENRAFWSSSAGSYKVLYDYKGECYVLEFDRKGTFLQERMLATSMSNLVPRVDSSGRILQFDGRYLTAGPFKL